MIQSTYRTIVGRYKTVETQLKKKPLYVPSGELDKNGKEVWQPVKRDLDWLWKPILFKRPQADYVRGMNYSFVQNASKISMNVLNKREKVAFDKHFLDVLLSKDVRLGTAKLVHACGKWYFHVSLTFEISDILEDDQIRNIVGIDRGLRFFGNDF